MARNTHGFHHQHDGNGQQIDPGPPAPPVTTPVDPGPPAPPAAPAFSDLGLTFNDATRALEGGLWQNTVSEGGQGLGSIGRYTTDLTNVQTGLQAEVAAGQFTGATLTHVNAILADITTSLSAATASVNGGGTFGSVAAAETALHNSHLDILNIVNNDANLATLATQNGAAGFLAAPDAFAAGTTAANAPHATFADIGAIFNDLANISIGGINASNTAQATADTNAAITDLQGLMTANPTLFGGLTGIHADTIVRQLQLEQTFINQAGVSQDAGRASNDNLLDIIDIVQGDTNLVNMANQNGVHGFTPFGDALNPTPKYLDNSDQTTFWANFIAQSNSLGHQAENLVGGNDAHAIAALISQHPDLPDDGHQLRCSPGRHLRSPLRQRAAGPDQHPRRRGERGDQGIADRQCGTGHRFGRGDARQCRRRRRQQHTRDRRHLQCRWRDGCRRIVDGGCNTGGCRSGARDPGSGPDGTDFAGGACSADRGQRTAGGGGYTRGRSASFAGSGDGAALPPHVGITADQRGLRRPVITTERRRSV